MAGKHIPDIPLLKVGSYREVYLKHDTECAPGVGPSLSHFEIHHRCIWNDVVPAHRLDFYMVFLVLAGEASHRFGGHEYKLDKNMLCFVGPDMISSWTLTSGDQRGYICAFSDDFFHTGLADRKLISGLPFFRLDSEPVLQRECEASLRRLATDVIDVYFIHGFDSHTPVEETLRALDDLVRAGKVRYVGCSNFAAWQLMKALSISERHSMNRYVVYQGYYSLVGRDYESELMPLARDQGVGLMVWSALGWGRLKGGIRRGQPLPAGRIQSGGARQAGRR